MLRITALYMQTPNIYIYQYYKHVDSWYNAFYLKYNTKNHLLPLESFLGTFLILTTPQTGSLQ